MAYQFPALSLRKQALLNALPVRPPAGFDDDEMAAFCFGVQDDPESIRSDVLARTLAALFGFVPTALLPNERLECIRRLTVCLNCGLADQAIEEARRAARHGVAAEQIVSLIGTFHAPAPGFVSVAL